MFKEKFLLNRITFLISLITLLSFAGFGIKFLHSAGNETDTTEPTGFIEKIVGKTISSIKTPINVFVLAGDQSSGNTDTMMVVHFDPVTCETKIISMPRDTGIIVDGRLRKINFAYPSGGIKYSAETVGTLLGINIDYYIYIDTKVFRETIDILGGVDYNIPVKMDYDDNSQNLHIHFDKGMTHLDGRKAEEFVRFRKPKNYKYTKELLRFYDGGDLKRIDAQQNFIVELVRQKSDFKYISAINKILKSVFSNIKTDLPLQTATRLLYNIKEMNVKKILTFRAFGKGQRVNSLDYYFFKNQLYSNLTQKYEVSDDFIAEQMQSAGLLFKANQAATNQYRSDITQRVNSLMGSSTTNNHTKATKKPIKSTPKPAKTTPKPTKKPVVTSKPTLLPTQAPTNSPKPEPTQIVIEPTQQP